MKNVKKVIFIAIVAILALSSLIPFNVLAAKTFVTKGRVTLLDASARTTPAMYFNWTAPASGSSATMDDGMVKIVTTSTAAITTRSLWDGVSAYNAGNISIVGKDYIGVRFKVDNPVTLRIMPISETVLKTLQGVYGSNWTFVDMDGVVVKEFSGNFQCLSPTDFDGWVYVSLTDGIWAGGAAMKRSADSSTTLYNPSVNPSYAGTGFDPTAQAWINIGYTPSTAETTSVWFGDCVMAGAAETVSAFTSQNVVDASALGSVNGIYSKTGIDQHTTGVMDGGMVKIPFSATGSENAETPRIDWTATTGKTLDLMSYKYMGIRVKASGRTALSATALGDKYTGLDVGAASTLYVLVDSDGAFNSYASGNTTLQLPENFDGWIYASLEYLKWPGTSGTALYRDINNPAAIRNTTATGTTDGKNNSDIGFDPTAITWSGLEVYAVSAGAELSIGDWTLASLDWEPTTVKTASATDNANYKLTLTTSRDVAVGERGVVSVSLTNNTAASIASYTCYLRNDANDGRICFNMENEQRACKSDTDYAITFTGVDAGKTATLTYKIVGMTPGAETIILKDKNRTAVNTNTLTVHSAKLTPYYMITQSGSGTIQVKTRTNVKKGDFFDAEFLYYNNSNTTASETFTFNPSNIATSPSGNSVSFTDVGPYATVSKTVRFLALEGGSESMSVFLGGIKLLSHELIIGGAGWYAGDAHTHTAPYSDGYGTIYDNVTQSRSLGLDFLISTDHNSNGTENNVLPSLNMGDLGEAPAILSAYNGSFINIKKGNEVSNPYFITHNPYTHETGHALAYNINKSYMEQINKMTTDYSKGYNWNSALADIEKDGGFVFAAHPFLGVQAPHDPWYMSNETLYTTNWHGVEVVNGGLYSAYYNLYALQYFDRLNARGGHFYGVANSDGHYYPAIGINRNKVYLPSLTEDNILDAFYNGAGYMTGGVDIDLSIESATMGQTLNILDDAQTVTLHIKACSNENKLSKIVLYRTKVTGDLLGAQTQYKVLELTSFDSNYYEGYYEIVVNAGEYYRLEAYSAASNGYAYSNPIWIEKAYESNAAAILKINYNGDGAFEDNGYGNRYIKVNEAFDPSELSVVVSQFASCTTTYTAPSGSKAGFVTIKVTADDGTVKNYTYYVV